MANHHFVPQFYFRFFSDDGRTIGALLTRDGRTIIGASIKDQCSKKNFYGSAELESLFSKMEGQHSAAIRALVGMANHRSSPDLTDEQWSDFLQAVAFQRGRTALEIAKSDRAWQAWMLEGFKVHLRNSGDPEAEEMIRHLDRGHVQITEDSSAKICRLVSVALSNATGLSDLSVCILRNRTDYPFIFSDAPVVFYNYYCRKVHNRGVLGIQSPGLQIFYPLNAFTLAMLYDENRYFGPFRQHLQYDVFERSDVSQLNALQLHHSHNAVYFGRVRHREYVQDLWHAHRNSIGVTEDRCVVGADFWIDGKPPEGKLIQHFAPQIDYELALSFIECEQIAESDYVFFPRNKELHAELRRRAQAEADKL